MFVTMAMTLRLFDTVPECMIETLLIVHGSGDRNSAEFTQVCERWTCILAPWIRTLKRRAHPCGKEYARWNGKYYQWWFYGKLYWKGVYCNGKKDGVWQSWWTNTRLATKGLYRSGKREGVWPSWYCTGRLGLKGMYCNGKKEGMWMEWYIDGQLETKGVYTNGNMEGEWQLWRWDGELWCVEVYQNGKLVTNQ